MRLSESQMRNQLRNYCFSAASLRHFRDRKGNQGRQSLTLHLARDVADRLERRFEPVPPAQLAPPEQIAQLPLQIVTDIESRVIRPILFLMRGDQSDSSQLIDLLCRSRRPILLHRLALAIAKADRLESFIRQLRVPVFDRDPFAADVNAIICFDCADINHVLGSDVLADLSAGVPTIHYHWVAVAPSYSPINQVTRQIQLAWKGNLPIRMNAANALENITQIFALLALLLLAVKHFRAIFDAVLFDPLDGLLDIHLIIPAQFQRIIDLPVSIVNRYHVMREAITFGAWDVPVPEQWEVLAVFLIVRIIHDQDRVLLGSRRRVFAQQIQATFVNRSGRPWIFGEIAIEATLVLDLNHEGPIDCLNGFVLGNEQTCQVAL